jgi:16S rRNA processing protein RimM
LGLLGKIKDILETGANDVYAVDAPKYGEILIPAIKEVILDVNIEKKEMQVKLLPGLIEE